MIQILELQLEKQKYPEFSAQEIMHHCYNHQRIDSADNEMRKKERNWRGWSINVIG